MNFWNSYPSFDYVLWVFRGEFTCFYLQKVLCNDDIILIKIEMFRTAALTRKLEFLLLRLRSSLLTCKMTALA